MSEAYKKLIKTLQTIFEMDKADLDFGIYRILNQKRDDINRFLEDDLLPQVKKAFEDYNSEGQGDLQQELVTAIEQARNFGAPDPENAPAVLEIRAKMANAIDVTALENDVFSKLQTFFSRYYHQGDFISQRRYKADTYSIPYEGEEVKLYWANHDQYYIKSSEHLRDYAFLAHENEKSVRIKLIEADTEKDNIKAKAGEERRFILDEESPLSEENGELLIHFNFVPAGKKKQEKLNEAAVETIFEQENFDEWLAILKAPMPTEKKPNRTLLERHLNEYTARNTFDYFIHKDLGGFLNRELDFFIKSEVLLLDDIDDVAFSVTEQHLRKIKIIRAISKKIIRMLAQLEEFQKKIWRKKKFVVNCGYCISICKLPEKLMNKVMASDSQWGYWLDQNMIAKDELENKERCLRNHPYLVVDTLFYDDEFKLEVEKNLDNVDQCIDGLLLRSENYQANNFLEKKYRDKVDLAYLDPPYNTDATPILYKNGYKESSWISLMGDRIKQVANLVSQDRAIAFAIDDTEQAILKTLINGILPQKEIHQCIIEHYPGSGTGRTNVSRTHEYCLFAIDDESDVLRGEAVEDGERIRGFRRAGTGDNNFRVGNPGRPESFYAILVNTETFEVVAAEPPPKIGDKYPLGPTKEGHKRIYPIGEDGSERVWTLSYVGVNEAIADGRIISSEKFVIKRIYHDKERRLLLPSIWQGSEFNATSNGTNLLTDMFGVSGLFSYPKAIGTLKKVIDAVTFDFGDACILDCFGGSGTTAHAIIERNRELSRKDKYILIEMGKHSDSITKLRIQKAAQATRWSSGVPLDQNGSEHLLKYLELESYEDALNNLNIISNNSSKDILKGNQNLKEDYMLGYWLDVETADSPSLLNIEQFEDPFNYKLNIGSGSVGATKATTVDLVETFNYLIGLTVKTIDVIKGFKLVTGTSPKGDSVLVVWRNTKEKDNDDLEAFLDKQGYNPRDTEFDHIYVNGDHTLEDPRSKVKMTEIEFKRLMFDVSDV